jgi:integrase/recombinase XerD
MRERQSDISFRSVLGNHLKSFIQEKQACGYRYNSGIKNLRRLDRFLTMNGLTIVELPKQVVEQWTARQLLESAGTHQQRIALLRSFTLYLNRMEIPAYVPDNRAASIHHMDFTPYIFRHDEIHHLIVAADRLRKDYRSPFRHLIIPIVFRLLYGCGMRVNEVLRLKWSDVDLYTGIITVREGKFRKDRLVPVASSTLLKMRDYAVTTGMYDPNAFFFQAPDGGRYSDRTLYAYFRRFLRECNISHGGRNVGPRMHDLRHTFAVHRLGLWYRDGTNLNAMLPVLAVYLGHQRMTGTQRYLRLTPDIFPDITTRLEASVGHVFPQRVGL